MNKMQGQIVSEEEAATGLGFKDVVEFRRWQTELGHKVSNLEYKLKQANYEIEQFQWIGRRCDKMLQVASNELARLNLEQTKELRLAIDIVRGKAADWDNILEKYLND